MKITFLGTAGSTLSKHRSYPAILINDDLLLDCGEGTTQKLLQSNSINTIRTIIFTHLHNDHLIGVFSLLWYYWINDRKEDLNIIGPIGTKNTIESILKLINTPEDMMKSFQIHYQELESTKEIQPIKYNYIMNYVDADHRISAFSIRIEDKKNSICYSGDTAPTYLLEKLAMNCDIFICEATMPDEWAEFAHEHFHCTPSDAATIANKIHCKTLVLFHIASHFIKQFDKFQQQAEKIFKKEVIIAKERMILEL